MKRAILSMLFAVAAIQCARADEPKARPALVSYFGKTPEIDGELSPGEWTDATAFSGVRNWAAQFSPVENAEDLSLKGWVKHDQEALYFAFEVTDDILYGIDTRAMQEVDELTERFGADAILARGGTLLTSQAAGPKLAWKSMTAGGAVGVAPPVAGRLAELMRTEIWLAPMPTPGTPTSAISLAVACRAK